MDVPKAQFSSEIVSIIQQIVKSHFVAIDLEFTGIPGRPDGVQAGSKETKTRSGKPTLQEVYEEGREAAKKFQILQVGLTIVDETENGTYILRPYNFYISPVPEWRLRMERTWTFSSGAVDFLLKHQFQFERPYLIGIPYVSRQEERKLRASWSEMDRAQESMSDMAVKPADEAWVQLVKDNINDWIGQPSTTRDSFLNLPPPAGSKLSFRSNQPLNSWQRRMIHQIVRNDFPGLVVASRNKGSFMQVEERKPNHDKVVQSERQRYRENDLARGKDFRWLIEALVGGDISNLPLEYYRAALNDTDRSTVTQKQLEQQAELLQKRVKEHHTVLVGHNLFLDLLYIYQAFLDDLPQQVDDFQAMLNTSFAAIIDTKWIATFKVPSFTSTSLDSLEVQLREQEFPKTELAEGFDKYESEDAYHEAGFDSYMTAVAAIKLSSKRKTEKGETEAGMSLALFGIDRKDIVTSEVPEEQYHTPPESLNESMDPITQQTFSSSSRSRSILSKPFATVKDAVAMMRTGHTKSAETASADVQSTTDTPHKSSGKRGSVLAPGVDTVRQALARTKISNSKNSDKGKGLLRGAQKEDPPANENTSTAEDLISSDDMKGDITDSTPNSERMPGWDDHGFWRMFGNRLKVQSCAEEVMQL